MGGDPTLCHAEWTIRGGPAQPLHRKLNAVALLRLPPGPGARRRPATQRLDPVTPLAHANAPDECIEGGLVEGFGKRLHRNRESVILLSRRQQWRGGQGVQFRDTTERSGTWARCRSR